LSSDNNPDKVRLYGLYLKKGTALIGYPPALNLVCFRLKMRIYGPIPKALHLCTHMRIWQITILWLALSACATGAKEDKRPSNVLSIDTMAALLQQVHVQEAELQTRRLHVRMAKDLFDKQWDSTVKAWKLDTARFSRSFTWYTQHVAELDKVYEIIEDSLGVEESRANGRPLDTATHAERNAPVLGRP